MSARDSPTLEPPAALASLVDVLDVRVSASTDDAEERADGSMYRTSSDLELVNDGGNQTVGMRFTGVSVPQGASISLAYVQFQVDQKSSETTVLTIEGEATDDALTFGATARDVSARTRTATSVPWEPAAWPKVGEAGADQRTPDIAAIIQEIVGRPGWTSGNALVLIVTGDGKRTAEAYDGVPTAAPLLHVEYLLEPVASVDVSPASATIGQGATVELTATPRDADGNPLSRAVTWSSGSESLATVSTAGLVTGVAPGSTTITAEVGGVRGSATIEVIWVPVASVEVEPVSATIATGQTVQLTATPLDPDGVPLPGRTVTWSSSDETVATVSGAGVVTGVGEGTATISAASGGQAGTSIIDVFVPPPGITPPNFKVAFIGDQGAGTDALNVLQLILDESAAMVIHSGDLDYRDDPALFDSNVTSVLGADYPYFVSAGNHDVEAGIWYGIGGYQEKLQQRLDLIPDAYCTGDLGVNSSCTYQGLFFILSGIGTIGIDADAEAYIRSALEADASDWRICSWHKNQAEMQVGGKGSSVGWTAYETCREQGAIIATGHEHSYSRTKTLSSTEFQIVDPEWPLPELLSVRPGATFVFVSGLGGASIRDQERCLPTTYPYGCNGEWASIYTSNQGAQHGALFIEFHVDGNPRKARGYFKNIFGEVIDQFTVWSASPSDPSNRAPVVMAGGDALVDEGATANTTATFTDEDIEDMHTATIDWGDGSGPESGTVTEADGTGTVDGSHVYADDGVYTVTVAVNDGRGGVASDSYMVTVNNVPPTADAGGPYAGTEGGGVSFSGAATDPGNDTFTFEWDFDYDGSTFHVDGSGADPSHAYVSEGSYTAALRVTDDDGDSDLATTTVDVTDTDPSAAFTFTPPAPSVGAPVTFSDASTSHDGVITWEWDFDVVAGATVDSDVQNPTYTYSTAGNYTVRLTVEEADGDVSWVEHQLVVTQEPVNTPPTATGVTIEGEVRVGAQLTGNYVYEDAENDDEGDSTYRWLRDDAPISGATAPTYDLTDDDHGTMIVFEVTPVALTGALEGTPVSSPAVGPVAAAPLEVGGITPDQVSAGSSATVTIVGSGFVAGASVTLENGSGPVPDVSGVSVDGSSTITATIAARSGGPRRDRPWDVRVTNPDGTSVVLVAGFTVTSGR